MRWRSVRLITGVAAALLSVSTLAPLAHAEDFLSALFGAFGARPRVSAVPLSFANEGDAQSQQSGARARSGYSGGSQAYCVRTCDGRYSPSAAPAARAAPRRATISARRAKPKWSMAAISIMPRPRAESPIRSCRMRFATVTNWLRGAPATAGTRPVSRRSRSRTIPRFAGAISSPAPTG